MPDPTVYTPEQTAALLREAERLVLALDAHRCPACGEPRRKPRISYFAALTILPLGSYPERDAAIRRAWAVSP